MKIPLFMYNKRMRGAFILFEGIDKSGKSTQSKKLKEFLDNKNIKSKYIAFPDRTTEIGKKIDKYLKKEIDLDDKEVHHLFSQNRWEKKDEIIKELTSGTTIIMDRYAFSGGFDLEWCQISDKGLPAPDIILFLDIPIEEASKRGHFGEERYEKVEFQKKVKDMYYKLMDPTWKILDANKPIEILQLEIQNIVLNVINEVKDKSIQQL